MRTPSLFLLAALLAGPAGADTIILYNNTNPAQDVDNDLTFSSGPYDGIGDSITLAANPFLQPATDAEIQFFNDGAAGTFDAMLLFFQAESPVGTQIGTTYEVTGISIAANSYATVDFNLGALTLPSDVVFLVEVSNVSAGVDPGLELYADPTIVGSNTPDSAIFLQGSTPTQQSTPGGGNPYFELTGAPEPSTWLLTGAGLAAAVWWKRRRAGLPSRRRE
ncbi:MAG: PEP-CTERM sorting domain-containing protein [Bryobacteraceae bacterium]